MDKYRTIVADPPWPERSFEGGGWRYASDAVRRIAKDPNKRYPLKALPYQTMAIDDIAALPISDMAEDESHLFVWTFDRFVTDGSTQRVIEAWGFRVMPRMIVWHKASAGLGTTMRPAHELVMIGRRGAKGFKSTKGAATTVGTWKQPYANGKIHSAKPEGFLDLVESLCDGPYLELFARRNRLGWETWGNESLQHVEMGAA